MGEERLNGLSMLYVHRNIDINLDDAVECCYFLLFIVLSVQYPLETNFMCIS